MAKFKTSGFISEKDSDEVIKFNFILWNQSIASQHAVHATLAGLSVAVLAIYINFANKPFDNWQKVVFATALFAIIVQVICLIYMSDHERRDSYPYGDTTKTQKSRENKARFVLKLLTSLSVILIGILLSYTAIFK